MSVMHEVISLLINRYDFFLQLLWEHIEISVLASVIATIMVDYWVCLYTNING